MAQIRHGDLAIGEPSRPGGAGLTYIPRRYLDYPSSNLIGGLQVVSIFALAIALWTCAILGSQHSLWAIPVFGSMLALVSVRAVILMHDCAHDSLLKGRRMNRIVGRAIGLFFGAPFGMWRSDHIVHHLNSGKTWKSDGTGDLMTWTIDQYNNASPKEQRFYRAYRHPLILCCVFFPIYYAVFYRVAFLSKNGRKAWKDVIITDVFFVVAYLVMALAGMNIWPVLAVHLWQLWLGAVIGGWLVASQHQHEHAYFRSERDWDFVAAAAEGSVFVKLPSWAAWWIAHINYHHVHHLHPQIPNYRLKSAHQDFFADCPTVLTVSFWETLRAFRFKLWDEEAQKMVDFKAPSVRHRRANDLAVSAPHRSSAGASY